MAAYALAYYGEVAKDIEKIDKSERERINEAIQKLAENPFPQGAIKVEGYKGQNVLRIRTGKYRILYLVGLQAKEIIIVKVDKRERVYG